VLNSIGLDPFAGIGDGRSGTTDIDPEVQPREHLCVKPIRPIVDVRPRPALAAPAVMSTWHRNPSSSQTHPGPPRVQGREPDSERNDGSALP